jgi:hypothetical protein
MIFSTGIVAAPLPEIARPELRSASPLQCKGWTGTLTDLHQPYPRRHVSQAPTRDGSHVDTAFSSSVGKHGGVVFRPKLHSDVGT